MAAKDRKPIGVSTSEDDVVKWDSEGAILVFDEKDFKKLSGDVVRGLSAINKKAYFVAKGVYDLENDPENGEVSDDFLISPESLRNQATNLLKVDLKDGLVGYHARPEDIQKFKKQGFVVAQQEHLKNPGEDKESLDIRVGGYTDLRLLVRTKEVADKYKAAKRKYNQELRSGKRADDGSVRDSKKELNAFGAGKAFESVEFNEE